ncbi:MAG: antitoxin [Erysipelotrichaceae bacterium]|nr:antitoxin [Erysipelotrichaceae bacterium]
MREMDRDGLIMCRMQGRAFEKSLEEENSSPVFIRRFMNSNLARRMDKNYFLNTNQSETQMVEEINEDYPRKIGSMKFDKEEMYWIGYLYRYWAYIWNISSKEIYRICDGNDMRRHYHYFHSLAPEKAIEKLMEEKHYQPVCTDEEKHYETIYSSEIEERCRKIFSERLFLEKNKI